MLGVCLPPRESEDGVVDKDEMIEKKAQILSKNGTREEKRKGKGTIVEEAMPDD